MEGERTYRVATMNQLKKDSSLNSATSSEYESAPLYDPTRYLKYDLGNGFVLTFDATNP